MLLLILLCEAISPIVMLPQVKVLPPHNINHPSVSNNISLTPTTHCHNQCQMLLGFVLVFLEYPETTLSVKIGKVKLFPKLNVSVA